MTDLSPWKSVQTASPQRLSILGKPLHFKNQISIDGSHHYERFQLFSIFLCCGLQFITAVNVSSHGSVALLVHHHQVFQYLP